MGKRRLDAQKWEKDAAGREIKIRIFRSGLAYKISQRKWRVGGRGAKKKPFPRNYVDCCKSGRIKSSLRVGNNRRNEESREQKWSNPGESHLRRPSSRGIIRVNSGNACRVDRTAAAL